MNRNLKLLLIAGLAFSLSAWFLARMANSGRTPLSQIRVSLEGYTNSPDGRSMALFRVENPNDSRVAFRVFGPPCPP